MRILIADNYLPIRSLYHELLRGRRHEVVAETGDGIEALELYRKLSPNLLILENHIPGLSGGEVAKLIRSEDKDVPIILCTVFPKECAREARAIGVKVIGKPFSIDEMLEAVDEFEV